MKKKKKEKASSRKSSRPKPKGKMRRKKAKAAPPQLPGVRPLAGEGTEVLLNIPEKTEGEGAGNGQAEEKEENPGWPGWHGPRARLRFRGR